MKTKEEIEELPNGVQLSMVFVEGASFMMGSDERKEAQPIHQVNVPDFYLGKYPITVGQYMAFVEATGSYHPEWVIRRNEYNINNETAYNGNQIGSVIQDRIHAIVGVSWKDAHAYCEWLSKRTEKKYRLPSEAEWEYAARGGKYSNGYKFAGSNKLKEVGWYRQNSHGGTKAVGQKWPNELGLYDMSGNVWEWCADIWHRNYEKAPVDGSSWVIGDSQYGRLLRGGSWEFDDYFCQVSYRIRSDINDRFKYIGFRIARY